MHCFTHTTTHALAICKTCNKALCSACYVEVSGCISCKAESCQQRTREEQEMIERGKKIYKIGGDQKTTPSPFLIMILLLGAISIIHPLTTDLPLQSINDFLFLLPGTFLLFYGVYLWVFKKGRLF